MLIYPSRACSVHSRSVPRHGHVIVLKMGQLLIDIALTAYPTFWRNLVVVILVGINLVQIAYGLYVVRQARESFTRRIRPPLVIKALLDMKGESIGNSNAQPLTLGMLERLEGIVKVRDQQKFNVHQGAVSHRGRVFSSYAHSVNSCGSSPKSLPIKIGTSLNDR